MINAKVANALTEEMFCISGFKFNIYKKIFSAIADGKSHIYVEYMENETLDYVLSELVNLDYKVTRTKKYSKNKNNGTISEYVYCISW